MMKTTKTPNTSGLTWLGGAIIFIGLIALAITNRWLGFSGGNSWPFSILLPGLMLILLSIKIKTTLVRVPLVFFGSLSVLLASFFFMFTLGAFSWASMRGLWPVFVLIPGVALLAAYLASGKKSELLLSTGLALAIGALVTMLILQLGGHSLGAGSMWPVLVIVVGVLLLGFSLLKKNMR